MKLSVKKQILILIVVLFLPVIAQAAYTPTPTKMPASNILDGFIALYKAKALLWQTVLVKHATWIFWTLATMEFAWMGIRLALRQADIQEFTIEVVKRIMFVGFFFALLTYGGTWASNIIDSFYQAANDASAASGGLPGITPSSLFDMAANMLLDVTTNISVIDWVAGFGAVLCALLLCVAIAITVAYLVVALVETYIAVSAGVILLGFGGSRWTKEYAVAYLKFAVGAGFKLFLTQLIIAIGSSLILDWMAYNHAHPGDNTIQGLMMLAGVTIIQAMLVAKIPGIAQGLLQGAAVGGGDELAAPAKIAAAGVGTVTGVAATVAAAKTGFGSALGAARALRSATSVARTSLSPATGQAFGNRVGGTLSSLTGSPSIGVGATRIATAVARTGAVARRAGSMLASAARDDARARASGTDAAPGVNSARGNLGSRLSAIIQRKG